MTTEQEVLGYSLDAYDWQKLVAIKKRLYDDRPLSGDQRRDLANLMESTMHKAAPVYEACPESRRGHDWDSDRDGKRHCRICGLERAT